MARPLLVALLMLLGAARAPAAPLDDEPIARAHYTTGLAYYDKSDFRGAVSEFVAAYHLDPRPALLYNIAHAYQRLGDAGRAVDFYERYLRAVPDAIDRDAAMTQLAALRPQVGEVVIESPLRDASIVIDGEPVDHGIADPITVTAGRHTVTLRRQGAVDQSVSVKLHAGEVRSLRLDLASIAQLQADARRPRRRWLWPVVGVSAALVVAAAITLGLTLRHTDYVAEARGDCPAQTCAVIDGSK